MGGEGENVSCCSVIQGVAEQTVQLDKLSKKSPAKVSKVLSARPSFFLWQCLSTIYGYIS